MRSDEPRQKEIRRRDLISGAAASVLGGLMIGAAGNAQTQQPATKAPAPPAPAGRVTYRAMSTEMVRVRGHQNDMIDAYVAQPSAPGKYPGVVVVHHMPGWDEGTVEIARTFAARGYVAISPNLQFREGKATPEGNSASISAAGGMPDVRTLGDVDGAVKYLRGLRNLNGKVGIIGYCSGGRQVYLAACKLKGIDAAVDCYGGGVGSGNVTPVQLADPCDLTKDLSCPLLGLFGKDDRNPSPEQVAKTEAELKKYGKVYEFHSYEGAGHAFFSAGQASYRQPAASDGWAQIFKWYEKYLS